MQTMIHDLQTKYTARGEPRFVAVVSHDGLGKLQEIAGKDPHVVLAKARGKAQQWDQMWAKRVAAENKRRERAAKAADKEAKIAAASEATADAQSSWDALGTVLEQALAAEHVVRWEERMDRTAYPEPVPTPPPPPAEPPPPEFPAEPDPGDSLYQDQRGVVDICLDLVMPSRRTHRVEQLEQAFQEDHARWRDACGALTGAHQQEWGRRQQHFEVQLASHRAEKEAWEEGRREYREAQAARNRAVDANRDAYESGEKDGVLDLADYVLARSDYPEWSTGEWQLDYDEETKLLVVEYVLPDPSAVPSLKEVKYVQSRDEFTEKNYSDAQKRKQYDALLYQVALRTLHELFAADDEGVIDTVAFNGRVHSVDPATGKDIDACVMSLAVPREDFLELNLAAVEPKACFRKLKGVGSSKLHSLTPIAPIVEFRVDDDRFVDSYQVVSTLDEGENLALMDWEDFEHLVREVFEREFAATGGEVRVTRASRDGGIDAVVFDPDPIRGGKIVIQAKRYTNTVGVSAVRDLYGSVLNEGANKGILVSTATFGPDAYAFAQDKPISLIDGGTLLHLMQKHGHRVRIDLMEARAARS